MKCYYAHPITSYGTQEEKDDIQALENLGFEVLNPNNAKYEYAYKKQGVDVFLDLVDQCDFLIFRAFEDERSTIPAGIWKEISRADEKGKLVFELPGAIGDRKLSAEETRAKLVNYGRKIND